MLVCFVLKTTEHLYNQLFPSLHSSITPSSRDTLLSLVFRCLLSLLKINFVTPKGLTICEPYFKCCQSYRRTNRRTGDCVREAVKEIDAPKLKNASNETQTIFKRHSFF